jgi:chromosome segregation ATPase
VLDARPMLATDTLDEAPQFVPETDLRAVLRQRDEAAAEAHRLRRELEVQQRAQREYEEVTRGGDGTSRRLALLREALVRKDQEILSLRTHQVTRERALHEVKENSKRAERARAELEARLRDREGVFAAIEQERARLTEALETARREREQAAATLHHVDQNAQGWRHGYEQLSQERDASVRALEAARARLAELESRGESVQAERQRLSEQHARDLAALRAELRGAHEAELGLLRQDVQQLTARLESLRESHAIALRNAEDDYAEERAALQAALDSARAEADVNARAQREELQAALQASRDTAQRLGAELDAARDALAVALRAQREGVFHHRDAMRLQGLSFHAERAMWEARVGGLSAEHAATLAAVRAEHAAELAAVRAEHAAALDALVASREALVATRDALAEARAAQAERAATREALAAVEAELAEAREALAAQDGSRADLERELEATREALGSYAVESAARVEAAERQAADLRVYRDRYARRLAIAMAEIERISTGATQEAAALAAEVRQLSGAVGRLTARLVVESAHASARQMGRAVPEPGDVDEAISLLADELPECVAQSLWAHRDTLFLRCRDARPS